jgi:hypothetical protein
MVLMLMGQLMVPVSAQEDSVSGLLEETATGIVDEVLFDNLSRLAGPSCSLYGLGVDLVNFFYDGQWSFIDPLLEVMVLFKNESWRELSWAMNDQREAYLEQLTSLEKRRCVLAFGLPEARAGGSAQEQLQRRELQQVQRQVTELRAKLDYFGIQQRNITLDKPVFSNTVTFQEDTFTFEPLKTDKIFYFLWKDAFDANWDQFFRESKQWLQTTLVDLQVVVDNLPDTCAGVVHIAHELKSYFLYAFQVEDGVYTDSEGNTYSSFQEFVQKNAPAITSEFSKKYCSAPARKLPLPEATSAEEQYEELLESLASKIDRIELVQSQVLAAISLLEQKRDDQALSPVEQDRLTGFYKTSGELQGMMEYFALVLQKVGTPSSQSLTRLSQKLSQFVEALLGVTRNGEGGVQSRIAISQRLQRSRELQLQKICGRIEQMYQQSGRSTADLPLIGTVNGKVYCRAQPDCADVDLTNIGTSAGREKLAECSGFLFNSSELGPSQQVQNEARIIGDDIGFILEQRSYNDLITLRDLHFVSLREKYTAAYNVQTSSTTEVGNILRDVSSNLYSKEKLNQNNASTKHHYGLMLQVYKTFWKFMDQQEGICLAPENPEE